MRSIFILIICLTVNVFSQYFLNDTCHLNRKVYYNDESQAEGEIDVYFIEISKNMDLKFYFFSTSYDLYYPQGKTEINRSEYFRSLLKQDSLALSRQSIERLEIDSSGFEFDTGIITLKYFNNASDSIDSLSLDYRINAKVINTGTTKIQVFFSEVYETVKSKKLLVFEKIDL